MRSQRTGRKRLERDSTVIREHVLKHQVTTLQLHLSFRKSYFLNSSILSLDCKISLFFRHSADNPNPPSTARSRNPTIPSPAKNSPPALRVHYSTCKFTTPVSPSDSRLQPAAQNRELSQHHVEICRSPYLSLYEHHTHSIVGFWYLLSSVR